MQSVPWLSSVYRQYHTIALVDGGYASATFKVQGTDSIKIVFKRAKGEFDWPDDGDEVEVDYTLIGSDNYEDEMAGMSIFLLPAHPAYDNGWLRIRVSYDAHQTKLGYVSQDGGRTWISN